MHMMHVNIHCQLLLVHTMKNKHALVYNKPNKMEKCMVNISVKIYHYDKSYEHSRRIPVDPSMSQMG